MKKHCLLIVLAVFLASIRATRAAGDPLSVPPGFERFFLSLRVLSQKVSEAAAEKGTFPGELTNLCGMAFVQGYVLGDPDDKDIILVGLRTKRRPQLHLDDLVVNVRNIWDGNDAPYCSLDPTEESIRALRNLSRMRGDAQTIFERLQSAIGPQQTRLGGVPEESRHAHVMIDADYHMKKVSQGIISVTGLTSCLDLIL